MAEGVHTEIERKFVIDMPDTEFLRAQPGCEEWTIAQTYVTAQPGETRRVRRVVSAGQTRYFRTFKRRMTALSAAEDEGEITRAQYEAYLRERDPARQTIEKTRLRIPWEGLLLEVDIYPFWQRQAVLEIELEREDQPYAIPAWLRVRREVTDDIRYKNVMLAQNHEGLET